MARLERWAHRKAHPVGQAGFLAQLALPLRTGQTDLATLITDGSNGASAGDRRASPMLHKNMKNTARYTRTSATVRGAVGLRPMENVRNTADASNSALNAPLEQAVQAAARCRFRPSRHQWHPYIQGSLASAARSVSARASSDFRRPDQSDFLTGLGLGFDFSIHRRGRQIQVIERGQRWRRGRGRRQSPWQAWETSSSLRTPLIG